MKRDGCRSVQRTFVLLRRMDRGFLPCVLLGGVLRALTTFIPILVMAQVVNKISDSSDFYEIITFALAGVLAVCVIALLSALAEKEVNVRSQDLSYGFETLVARKTMTMDYAQMDSEETKRIQSRIKTDRSWGSGFFGVTAKIQSIVQQIVNIAVAAILLLPLLGNTLMNQNYFLLGTTGLAICISVASALFFDQFYSRRESVEMNSMTQTESKSRFRSMTEGNSAITYQNIKDILIYRASALIGSSVEAENEKVHGHALRLSRLNFMGGMIKGGFSGVLLGLSYCMAAFCAYAGQMAVGYVVQYAQALFQMSIGISTLMQTKAELRVDTERLVSTIDYLEIDQPLITQGVLKQQTVKKIEFRDVSFSYPGSKRHVIDGLTATIDASKKTAIVGLNGSGKTTLIKLLCRLYRPDQGAIFLDGIDIWDYDETAYRDLLAVVFQDFSLFSFSLGSVVASSENYDVDRVKDALRRAGMDEWVRKLEKGVDTILYKEYEDEGVDVSRGEAQKIAIARAIYKEASLVILDEPTAALDPQAEFDIYTRFADLIGSKGVIYISHRLSSCRFCDEIVVMDNGRVIEQGTHPQLLNSGGRYAEMWNAQAQYYKEEG